MTALLPIYDITKFTLLDYPDKTACILWFAGCNMRCQYCYNSDIIRAKGVQSETAVLEFLKTRQNKLEGVVLSGGECTGYPDLAAFAAQIKKLGFVIKMDTNGTKPQTIKKMVEEGLVDYIAMDFKAPQSKFYMVTKSKKFAPFLESLAYLCQQDFIPFEVRTTVHTGLLHENDLEEMMQILEDFHYKGTYYLQNYRHCETEGSLEPQPSILKCDQFSKRHFNVEYRNF